MEVALPPPVEASLRAYAERYEAPADAEQRPITRRQALFQEALRASSDEEEVVEVMEHDQQTTKMSERS